MLYHILRVAKYIMEMERALLAIMSARMLKMAKTQNLDSNSLTEPMEMLQPYLRSSIILKWNK